MLRAITRSIVHQFAGVRVVVKRQNGSMASLYMLRKSLNVRHFSTPSPVYSTHIISYNIAYKSRQQCHVIRIKSGQLYTATGSGVRSYRVNNHPLLCSVPVVLTTYSTTQHPPLYGYIVRAHIIEHKTAHIVLHLYKHAPVGVVGKAFGVGYAKIYK